MKAFRYCLRQHPLWAEIAVALKGPATDKHHVSISENAFAWLKQEYGPDAKEWQECATYRAKAIFGVGYALQNTPPLQGQGPISILITEIKCHPAHSTGDAVAYAACYATWGLLDVKPRNEPVIDGSKISFR